MEFRRELNIKPYKQKISLSDKIMLIGSCFSENLGAKLKEYKFDVRINPNGTLFNPISICKSIQSFIQRKEYLNDDLFLHEALWKSWDHHSQFSRLDQHDVLHEINTTISLSNQFLKQADWLVITLGTAWVYERENGVVVANCHKVPAEQFNKRLLSADEVSAALEDLIHALIAFNPSIKIMFTISPVRHLRDGFVENNRSKAVLIQAVHNLIESHQDMLYFPAYELIIDDLRDYRFYADDMVHPNQLAINYVWEKFQQTCISEESIQFFQDIYTINSAKAHRPFQADTPAHKKFREKYFALVQKLKAALPYLNWQPELDYFKD